MISKQHHHLGPHQESQGSVLWWMTWSAETWRRKMTRMRGEDTNLIILLPHDEEDSVKKINKLGEEIPPANTENPQSLRQSEPDYY